MRGIEIICKPSLITSLSGYPDMITSLDVLCVTRYLQKKKKKKKKLFKKKKKKKKKTKKKKESFF